MSTGSSDSDLEIPLLFLPFYYDVEALFSSFPGWLEIDARSFSTLITSWKFFTKVFFSLIFTNIATDGGKVEV